MYQNASVRRYVDDLAARIPAPGGGSAAAMTAALGAACISMVINFTLGKPRYAKYEEELKKLLDTSEKLRSEFLRLVDLDVEAFKSKDARKALDVPLMVARLSYEGAKLCPPLLKKGNVNLISDVGCAVVFLEAAFVSACMNVRINLRSMDDKKLCDSISRELLRREKAIKRVRQRTEEYVGEIIRR